MNTTLPVRFRRSSPVGVMIDPAVTRDPDYSKPLPPSAWTVSNPTTPSAQLRALTSPRMVVI